MVNNAGILEHQKKFVDLDYERLQRIFNANVMGPFRCCQEAVKRMSTKFGGEGGTIVNVSSIASKTGAPFEYTDYAAAKGALDTLTIGLSKEIG